MGAVPQPLRIAAAHTPAVFVRGETGTLTLTVSNPTDGATDGSDHDRHARHARRPDARPARPAPGGRARDHDATCTRNDVLAPGACFPPITLSVRVAATAAAVSPPRRG